MTKFSKVTISDPKRPENPPVKLMLVEDGVEGKVRVLANFMNSDGIPIFKSIGRFYVDSNGCLVFNPAGVAGYNYVMDI